MAASPIPPDVSAHLPLRPVALAALAALTGGPLPGIDVLERVNGAVSGHPILGPGTLYRLLRELRQEGWIEAAAPPAGDAEDARRSYHRLTPAGRAVLHAEAARLRRTLDAAGLMHPEAG